MENKFLIVLTDFILAEALLINCGIIVSVFTSSSFEFTKGFIIIGAILGFVFLLYRVVVG